MSAENQDLNQVRTRAQIRDSFVEFVALQYFIGIRVIWCENVKVFFGQGDTINECAWLLGDGEAKTETAELTNNLNICDDEADQSALIKMLPKHHHCQLTGSHFHNLHFFLYGKMPSLNIKPFSVILDPGTF